MKSSLTPAYWGSFLALVSGLFILIGSPLWAGYPDHVTEYGVSLYAPIFFASVLIVLLLTLRYYVALAVHTYGGSPQFVMNMPANLRITTFIAFVILVFLCALAARILGNISIPAALFTCGVMAVVSAFICGIVKVSANYQSDITPVKLTFGGADIIIASICVYLGFMLSESSHDTQFVDRVEQSLPIAVVGIYIVMHHEFMQHIKTLIHLIKELKVELVS